jgi:hypothetical protein
MTKPELAIPHNTETARDFLNTLNRMYDVSWERIASVIGVPVGTLWHIANGGKIPPKWKPKLGVYYKRVLYDMPVAELRWALENREEI